MDLGFPREPLLFVKGLCTRMPTEAAGDLGGFDTPLRPEGAAKAWGVSGAYIGSSVSGGYPANSGYDKPGSAASPGGRGVVGAADIES